MDPQNILIRTIELDLKQDAQQVGDCSIAKRNYNAVQSALMRGDAEVVLFNWKTFPPTLWQFVSRPWDQHPIGQAAVSLFTTFAPRNAPCDPSGNLSQDARNNIENKCWQGMKFKFIKVLAKGGHGYATLWDVVFEDKSVRRVVIKRALNPLTSSFDPREEARFHLRYDGAQHTTQVIDLHREAVATRTRMMNNDTFTISSVRHGKEWNAEEQNCVVFEYMKFGDMVNIMQMVSTRNVQIPAQVLWGIWECLVLGLATIAYTPSDSSGNSTFETWWKDVVSDRDEAFAFLGRVDREWKIEHDVHLDLELLNVLAGHDPATHPNQPVFKLHDLGACSYSMNQCWESHNEDQIWDMRGPVKPHAATPEQFSKEWDNLGVSLPEPALRQLFGGEDLEKEGGNKVAGRFGMWTNIFLIAKVMESIMTGEFSRFPYQATNHNETNKPTYGWRLLNPQFQHIDLELRRTVTMCLHEEPKDRPRITQLLWNVLERREQGFNNEGPESVQRWWKALLEPQAPKPIPAQAPPPANPVKQAVVASATKGGLAIASHMAQAAGNQGVPNQPQAAPHIPPHIQQILNQQRNQPNIKGPPAQPPAQPPVQPPVQPPFQPPVQPPVQPQARPKVLPHLRHVPSHLRNLPFDQRGAQLDPREPPAQHQAPPQAQARPQVQLQAPPKVPPHLRHVPSHLRNLPFDQRRAQIAVKESPAQPPAQLQAQWPQVPPQVPPQAQPQAPPKVLPHLRHVPAHLRNLPFDQRRAQPHIKESPAQPPVQLQAQPRGQHRGQHQGRLQGQHQGQRQGQRQGQYQGQRPGQHRVPPRAQQPPARPQVQPQARPQVQPPVLLQAHWPGPQPQVQPQAQQPQVRPGAQPYVPPHLRRGQHNVTTSALGENLGNIHLKRATQIFTAKVTPDISPKSVKSGRVSKKAPKAKKASRKVPPRKHDAIAEYVKKVLPDMPVAIRNLLTRSQHLESQLEKDGFRVYSFVN